MKLKIVMLLTLVLTLAHSVKEDEISHKKKEIFYGEILTIENAGAYKYLKVNEEGETVWVAIANAPVSVGDKIGYDKKTIMKDFKSKSLNRMFKEVIFASNLYLPQKGKKIKDLQDMLGLSSNKKELTSPKKTQEKPAKPFTKKEFYTVEEIFMWRDDLKDSIIKVKGTIKKISREIMKVDWVHIGDGTGKSSKKNDDIVFTAKKVHFKTGDKVIAAGKLILDKDFGYGYFYPVIVQDSNFTAQ